MNRELTSKILALILCMFTLQGLANEQAKGERDKHARYETACPPGSDEDKARIGSQLSEFLGDELRQVFGADSLPLKARVEQLTDGTDQQVCQYLNRVHSDLINSRVEQSEDAGARAYKYSVAYFEAGSFYLVRVGINPERRTTDEAGLDRVVLDRAAGTRVHLKDTLDLVRDHGGFVFGPEYRKLVNERIRERLAARQQDE